jgi:hypothetical protein
MYGDMPNKTNSSYYFKVTHGHASTPDEARNLALAELVSELARAQSVTVQTHDILQQISDQHNNSFNERVHYESNINISSEGFKARFEIVDEYADGKDYWILFEVANNPQRAQFDRVEFTTNYGGSALWRSILAPGWGQMHKRSMPKGIIILTAEVASIAGALVCENMRSTYYNKTLAERNTDVRAQYQNRTATFRNVRNGLIAAACAVYVYNIVDVVSAKGAKRYKVAIAPQGVGVIVNF